MSLLGGSLSKKIQRVAVESRKLKFAEGHSAGKRQDDKTRGRPSLSPSRDANLTRSAIAAFHDTIKSYDFVE
jgi:hypothetical protein